MKNRIIASVLVVVMLALALVGCGSFSFSDEDLSAYVTEFDYAKFMAELKKIELEKDGDFTTDEETRKKKVEEAIFAAMSKTAISEADKYEFDKLETGKAGAHDVVYFCYYATDADGNIYFFDQMKESTLTASSTKAKHNAQLGLGKYTDEFIEKVVEALAEYDFDANGVYSMLTAAYLDDNKVAEGDKIVVSYTVEYKKKNDKGVDVTYKESAKFEEITVSAESDSALAKKLSALIAEKDENNKDKNSVKVGSTVKVGADKTESFKVTGADGIEYTYSAVKPEWKVEKAGTPVSFKYTPHSHEAEEGKELPKNEYTPDNLRSTSAGKVNLTNVELTYYVYPVYRLAIPEEITAANILRYAFGSSLAATSFDIFSDEAYKNGDKTIKTLIDELSKIYKDTYTNDTANDTELSGLKDAYDAAAKAVKDAGANATDEQKAAKEAAYKAYIEGATKDIYDIKKLYDDAAKAVKAAGDDVTEEQEQFEEDTFKAYTETKRAKLSAKIDEILAAKSTATDAKAVADTVVEDYKEEKYHSLREEYDNFIIEAVESAVYELLFNNDDIIKVKAYPEDVLADFEERILEQYEYDFYKGYYNESTKESNYTKYGTFEKFLEAKIKTDGEIADQAKEALAPILKLYAVAKVFEAEGAAIEMVDFVKDDIAAGKYDAEYAEDADEKTKADAIVAANENKEAAIKNAEQFFVDDEVFKEFKKSVGAAAYRQYEKEYGEINIRASMQFNNLFYYLTSTRLEKGEDDEHPHTKYKKTADGSYVLSFRNINYTFKAEDAK